MSTENTTKENAVAVEAPVETAASTEANQKTESKDEGGDDADSNDFEKVMKANYYDTAVDQQRVHLIKPIIR